MSAVLESRSLCFGYGAKACCAMPLDFSLVMGEVVVLMGENGCGKSTLLKTFAGLVNPVAGTVALNGRSLGGWTPRDRARRVALVRMNQSVPDRMTVREFVSLGRIPYSGFLDCRSAEDERSVDEAMDLLDVDAFASRPIAELSDGERSRVFLAQALAQQVNVLLLDEPNAFLDIPRSHALFRLLKKIAAERQMGIVVSTHSVEYAERYADRILVIDPNRVRVSCAGEARSQGLFDWTEI